MATIDHRIRPVYLVGHAYFREDLCSGWREEVHGVKTKTVEPPHVDQAQACPPLDAGTSFEGL